LSIRSILKYDMKSYQEMDVCQIFQISVINQKNNYLRSKSLKEKKNISIEWQ